MDSSSSSCAQAAEICMRSYFEEIWVTLAKELAPVSYALKCILRLIYHRLVSCVDRM